MTHSKASATAVNMMGAERRPNGRALSKNRSPLHCMARSRRSDGDTGMLRNASWTSAFAIWEPCPRRSTVLAMTSVEM